MFRHQGLAEDDAFPPTLIRFGSMTPDMRVTTCSLLHANRLDLGYVLQHGLKQELVRVLGIVVGAIDCHVELERGYNGTKAVLHGAGDWTIVSVPHVDFRTAQEKEADRIEQEHAALSWNCTNCGGPNYNTDICRWCGNHQ